MPPPFGVLVGDVELTNTQLIYLLANISLILFDGLTLLFRLLQIFSPCSPKAPYVIAVGTVANQIARTKFPNFNVRSCFGVVLIRVDSFQLNLINRIILTNNYLALSLINFLYIEFILLALTPRSERPYLEDDLT